MVILLVSSHKQFALLLHLIDLLFDGGPALPEFANTHTRRSGLGLEIFQELLRVSNVVRWAEPECALTVRAARIKLNLLVHLKNAPKGLHVALIMGTVLERQVRDDIRKLERNVLVLHVLDRKQHLRHNIFARACVGRLRVDDIRVMALLFDLGRR